MEEKAAQIVKDVLDKKPDIYLTGSQIDRLERLEKKWIERLGG
jgi:hypothetical protein